jgi:hypothetical protein
VCGGADYTDQKAIFFALDRVLAKRRITMLIHGTEPGADRLATEWAISRKVPSKSCHTLRGGNVARRNSYMLTCSPDGLVAFPGGEEVLDMISKAKAAGLTIWQPYR